MGETRPAILQIIPRLDTGGAELAAIEISEAIVRSGGCALVLTEGGAMLNRLEAAGGEFVPFHAASKNPATILRNAQRIRDIAIREQVRLLHARSRAPAWSALLAARRLDIPFVTTYHGAYSENSKPKRWYNSVMARSDCVIANSEYTANLIKARYRTPADKIRVIYRGVDLARFDMSAVAASRVAALKAKWGLSPQTKIVLHAARLTGWKGQHDVIALADRVQARFPDCVFVLAGADQGRSEYRASLVSEIAKRNLETKVLLVGNVDDMPAALAAATVTFVASREPEAFGRAAAEAQAMGCPVISTNIGAPPETVLAPPRVRAAERTGWLVAPGALDAYEAALTEALSMTETEKAGIAARARRHVETSFTVANMQAQTLAVYDRLAGTNLSGRFVAARALEDHGVERT